MKQIKIVIIDDSHVIHILLEKILSQHEEIDIIGNAYDGREGFELVKKMSPDVIIMDIGMPRMDGIEAIQEIMNEKPTPIIVFSSASKNLVDLGFKAIEYGAVHLVEKPQVDDLTLLKNSIEENLIKAIKTFADFKVIRRIKKITPSTDQAGSTVLKETAVKSGNKVELKKRGAKTGESADHFPVIGIAASTGGPQTIKILIEDLSARKINAAIIIVQHMAEGFMKGFSDWLQQYSSLPVILPEKSDYIQPNNVYVAPGEYHLTFDTKGRFAFLDTPPVQGIRPSADIMFASLGEIFKERVIAVVLTGMGSDGTAGLYKVKEYNGYVISQDEESSLIFGMPKSAIESGLTDKVMSISDMAGYIEKICRERFSV